MLEPSFRLAKAMASSDVIGVFQSRDVEFGFSEVANCEHDFEHAILCR